MWNLFSDLKNMGFGQIEDGNLFEKEEESKKKESPKKEVVELVEYDFLFDKNYECPVCNKTFISKTVRSRKAKLLNTDTDLRPIYERIEPLKYNVVACPHCGYAALPRVFEHITSAQKKLILEKVTSSFTGLQSSESDIYTYAEAEERYKLALISAVAAKMRNSERAYLCLKLGWMYRAQKNELMQLSSDNSKEIAELEEKELSCIKMAYDGLQISYTKEVPPICGMDINTVGYLLADLARQCKDYPNSLRYAQDLITSNTVNERVKERARMVKEMVNEEKKQQAE